MKPVRFRYEYSLHRRTGRFSENEESRPIFRWNPPRRPRGYRLSATMVSAERSMPSSVYTSQPVTFCQRANR